MIELVVVIVILGILAAIAVPRFLNVGTAARVASVKAFAGTLQIASDNVRLICKMDPVCPSLVNTTLLIGGRPAALYFGYLDAGDNLGGSEIDSWVTYSGFTPVLENPRTRFALDGAPDPANCWAAYTEANSWSSSAFVTTATGGC